MHEDPRRYPLLRGRRRRRLLRRWRRRGWGPSRAATLLILLLAVAGAVALARRGTRPDPRVAVLAAVRSMDAGDYSGARDRAKAAVAADPASGAAHLVLARALLQAGDGAGAAGELTRAGTSDLARAHQLVAEAALLTGDPDRAIIEASRAGPAYRAYADRVTARALAAKGDVARARATLGAVILRSPGDGQAWRDLGRIRLDAGDLGGAADAAGRAVALMPGEPGALVLEGEVARERGGLTAALPWFDAALRRDGGYVPALLDRAATLGDAGRYREMLAATRRALAERAGEPRALYLEAVLAARAGRRDLARELLAGTRGAVDQVPGALLLQGSLDYADGRYEQAILRWRGLLDRQPTNLAVRRLLGAALLRSGEASGALDVLRPIVARADADSYTLALSARASEAIGDRRAAARLLDRAGGGVDVTPFAVEGGVAAATDAVRSHPGDPARLIELIRALLGAGQGADALAKARLLVRAGPGAPAAWLALGDVEVATGQMRTAIDAYARAATLRFDEPTMLRLADALARTGARGRAAQVVALYWSQNPDSVAAARLAAALQLDAGAWTAATLTLARVGAGAGWHDPALLLALARAHGGAGDWTRARAEAGAAYRLAPGNAAAAGGYGWSLWRTGDAIGAAEVLAKAAALAPGSGVIRQHLARAQARAKHLPAH